MNVPYILTNENHFPKTTSQLEFDYGLLTKLLRIIVAHGFLLSLSKLTRGIPPPIDKIGILTWKRLVILSQNVPCKTPLEFTTCKISHMCHCGFNFYLWKLKITYGLKTLYTTNFQLLECFCKFQPNDFTSTCTVIIKRGLHIISNFSPYLCTLPFSIARYI